MSNSILDRAHEKLSNARREADKEPWPLLAYKKQLMVIFREEPELRDAVMENPEEFDKYIFSQGIRH